MTNKPDEEIKPLFDLWAEQRIQFFAAVGQAITFWAATEERLVQIAATLIPTTEDKAGAIFYSINSIHAWMEIIDNLFQIAKPNDKASEKWNDVRKKIKGMNDTRIRLAHQFIHETRTKNDTKLIHVQASLRTNRLDIRTKWTTGKRANPLTKDEIHQFTLEVCNINDDLVSIFRTLHNQDDVLESSP
jgi:hypothetical protein